MGNPAEIIAQHYRDTYAFTIKLWEQRNRIFLILLFVVGLGALLTFNVDQAQPLLVDFIAKLAGIETPERLQELRDSFPYGLIQSVILMIILYLMLQLYHRTINIKRNYQYLEGVEIEIRSHLQLPADSISFTRESTFYWEKSPSFSKHIGSAYILLLGVLLCSFLGMRVYRDLQSGNIPFVIIDATLAITTLIFYAQYAYAASKQVRYLFAKNGKRKRKQHKKEA